MVRLTKPFKRFALAGALLFGCLPGVAQAKWIKATVSGTKVLANEVIDGVPPNVNDDIGSLTFVFQNYTGAVSGTAGEWAQIGTTPPNYQQLFGYGTGTGGAPSDLLKGNYDASSTAYNSGEGGMGNFIKSNRDGTNFNLRVGTQGASSGLTVATGNASAPRNVEFILLENGSLSDFSSTTNSSDVVDFLKASLGGTTYGTHTCAVVPLIPTQCRGTIQTASEGAITFSWSTIQFDEIEAVPAPLPIAGALAGFRLSRKIRSRIKAN